MNVLTRSSAFAAFVVAGSVYLSSCSGGVSVPAAGSVATPTAIPATATPVSATTPPITVTSTPTPVSVTTTAPAVTPTPTSVATGVTTTPTPTAPPTSTNTAPGCPPTFPSPQPVSSSTAFPNKGGTVNIPNFGDQIGSVILPTSNASGMQTLTFMTSQTPFTDAGGNGAIPTPQPGYSALSYTASGISGPTFTFGGDQEIMVSAKAPCEITFPGTYVAYVYANGGGFNHSELSPVAGYPAPETSAMDGTIQFTISLASTSGLNPQGVNLETVFAKKN